MRELWSVFRRGLKLLTPKGRQVLYTYGAVLVLLAGLDAVALYFVSKVFTAGNSSSSSIEISSGGFTLVLVICLFVVKTVLSTLMSWIVVKRFAKEEVQFGVSNFKTLMNLDWTIRVDSPITDLYNGVDRGPNNMVQGLIINVVTIAAEAATAAMIFIALMFLQPQTAIIAAVYFVLVAIIQHKLLSVASANAGQIVVEKTNSVYELLTDAFNLGKLLSISNSKSLADTVDSSRQALAIARSKVAFLGTLPRYFMELILAVGLGVIAGITYAISGTQGAISALTVFAAAGFRLLPIINRIQGLILHLFSTLPAAKLVFIKDPSGTKLQIQEPTSSAFVELRDIEFRYPTSVLPVLTDVNIEFLPGLQYAIVGPSGAGKTTLVDLCLGLLQPQHGTIRVQPGLKIAYVPQETYIARIPLEGNIALEWEQNSINLALVNEVAEKSSITGILDGRSSDFALSGTALSGGQKQRIGLARALYRQPDLLFLDEVTSALDAETEHAVMKSVQDLRGHATVVIVAHRLSTVQHADQVVYMEAGRILGIGTFEELRRKIPSLQRQIELGTLDLLD